MKLWGDNRRKSKQDGVKFILHIGSPKTGTSAIQSFLGKYSGKLLEKYSILYPKTGRIRDRGVNAVYPIHTFFPLSLNPFAKKIYGEQVNAKNLKNSLIEEIEISGPDVVLLSSEQFSQLNKEKILEFKKTYGFFVTSIIFYIRRQDTLIESLYKQYIKDHNNRTSQTFSEYVNEALSVGWEKNFLNYYTYLTYWKQAFPEAKIIVRVYDRKKFPKENIILDFLSVLGIDIPEAREYKIEVNPSISNLSSLVLRKINEKFNLSPEDHVKVVNYLLQLDKQEGSQIKTFFTLQERIEFLERFRESNEKLFREYFGTENQFVLSEEEIEFYKEQDKIPREVIGKAVEERYRKVLEFMKANGMLAKEGLFPRAHVNYLPNDFEFFRIDILNVNLLNGKLTISGLALPRKDIEENLKLTIKDAEGVKEVQWSLPSPVLGEQRKDNPKAKNARFRVDNVVVSSQPIEVFVNGKKIAEIRIEKISSSC